MLCVNVGCLQSGRPPEVGGLLKCEASGARPPEVGGLRSEAS